VKVDSLTFSYTPWSMRCDSQASFLARTFASHCLGCEPKVKVVTLIIYENKSYDKKKVSKNGVEHIKNNGRSFLYL